MSRVLAWAAPFLFLRGAEAAPQEVSTPPNQEALLTEMAQAIAPAVARRDTVHPVFHGCVDWHSAVHGHWALLRVARTLKPRRDLGNWVDSSLDAQRLAAEADFVRQHPRFEMPYGRAWFLRLAIEHESWRNESAQLGASPLRPLADEIAGSLAAYYEQNSPSPESAEYNNDAWALVQLYAFYAHRSDVQGQRRIEALVDERFVNNLTPVGFADDFERPEFFSRFGNWAYLIAHTKPTDALDVFWKARAPTGDDLRPVIPIGGKAHHLGMNWSRAWALRAVSRRTSDEKERKRLDAAYLAHVKAGTAIHEQFKGDYGAYGHWVPQFAVYALTE